MLPATLSEHLPTGKSLAQLPSPLLLLYSKIRYCNIEKIFSNSQNVIEQFTMISETQPHPNLLVAKGGCTSKEFPNIGGGGKEVKTVKLPGRNADFHNLTIPQQSISVPKTGLGGRGMNILTLRGFESHISVN